MDWKIELVAIPVTDVDRAKAFYVDQVGFHADHDYQVSDADPGGSCTKTTCSSRSTPARWRADCARRGSAVPRSTWPVTGSGSRRPVDVGRPLVGAGLHRGAVEELVVAGNPAAGGDRLGPALGQRAD